MHRLDRVRYIQESWGATQASVNVETYSTQYGLFLDDGEESEVSVVFHCERHPCPNAVVIRGTSDGTPTTACEQSPSASALDCTDPSKEPAPTTHHQPFHICGYCRVILDTPDRIQSFFSNNQPHLAVIHVDQDNSFECLRITRQCFEQLMQSCSMMPALKDSILHIGYRDLELEVAPPCPRSAFLFRGQDLSLDLQGFEAVYGLRFIEPNNRPDGRPWSLRQCVVYNRTSLDGSPSLWFFCHLPQPLRALVDDSILKIQHGVAIESFDIHNSLLATTIAMWRPFFIWITDKVERYAMKVSLASVGDESSVSLAKGNSMVELKQLENEVLDALSAIKAARNVSVFLRALSGAVDLPGTTVDTRLDSGCNVLIDYALNRQIDQIDALIEQATAVLQKIKGTSSIIRSFLELSSGHSLEELASQSRHESGEMAKLANIANRDAKAIKALSVIALVYLPVTVILNFFSTSFVDGSTGSVHVIGGWWLIFAISVPLTAATLFAWAIWSFRPRPHAERLREQNRGGVSKTSVTQSSEASLVTTEASAADDGKSV